MTAGVRFADPLSKAIVLERLLSAELSAAGTLARHVSQMTDDQWRVLVMIERLCGWRAFTLLRDMLDPRPAPRARATMGAQLGCGSPMVVGIRGWRRLHPELELS